MTSYTSVSKGTCTRSSDQTKEDIFSRASSVTLFLKAALSLAVFSSFIWKEGRESLSSWLGVEAAEIDRRRFTGFGFSLKAELAARSSTKHTMREIIADELVVKGDHSAWRVGGTVIVLESATKQRHIGALCRARGRHEFAFT